MMKKLLPPLILCLAGLLNGSLLHAEESSEVRIARAKQTFIDEMVKKHGFDRQQLTTLFDSIEIRPRIVKTISSPAEAKPWSDYRKIFMTESRIKGGVDFWTKHADVLARVSERYGVPVQIIVAILGVETRYGGHTGSHKVIEALSTLAFDYPKRSKFFRSELEHFLILARDEGMPPETVTGSYAGAMGLPQFMPSSYRSYAADFDNDGKHDIWSNTADTAASIANYFSKHGWITGEAVAYNTQVNGENYKELLSGNLKPEQSLKILKEKGVEVPDGQSLDEKAILLELRGENGKEYWLGLPNFYVITRYNHSPLYAMAVYQLSEEIRQRYQKQS